MEETPAESSTPSVTPTGQNSTAAQWRGWIDASVRLRKEHLRDWKDNVAFRMQKPFGGGAGATDGPEADQVAVPEDWARSRQKTAQLSFQVPKIVMTADRPEFEAAAPVCTQFLNKKLDQECRASYVIDEGLADVVNAAGLIVVKVGVDQRFETIEQEIPGVEPVFGPDGTLMPGTGTPPTMQPVRQKIYQRFTWDRVSPSALLWPTEFTGSDWDKAPWLGCETYVPIAEARKLWPSIPADWTPAACTPELTSEHVRSSESKYTEGGAYVKVQEVWYKAALYDADKFHPECLRRKVFIDGLPDPVEEGDSDWQVWVPATPGTPPGQGPDGQPTPGQPPVPGHYLGLRRFPIRVGTLVYVSDVAVPPSDSQAGRPQVREMIRSRSQMIQQRDHSIPMRWFDTNRVDPEIGERMKRGEWQGWIPMNGSGDRAIGEVARASYPRENFQFQSVIGGDLDRSWSLSNNQLAATNTGDAKSASEVNVMANANGVRLDYEKSRISRFIAEAAEVTFSLMQRFYDAVDYVPVVGQDGVERMTPVTESTLAGDFLFTTKADSSDRVDIVTKQNNALKLFNLLAQSPSVNRMALEREIIELHGLDPNKIVAQPQPKGPEPAAVSYRFGGADLLNPMAVAVMLKNGTNLGPTDIKAAATMIKDSIAAMGGLGAMQSTPPNAPAETPFIETTPLEVNEPLNKRLADGSRMT